MDPYLFDKPARKRRDLFLEKGWGEAPYDPEARYELMLECMRRDKFEQAFALFDPIVDCQNGEFLELVANIYDNQDSPYFDLSKAAKYYKKAYNYLDTKHKLRPAYYYLRCYFEINNIQKEDLFTLHKDPFIRECILIHMMYGYDIPHLDSVFPSRDYIDTTKRQYGGYLLAVFIGAGNGFDQDHVQALKAYRAYIEETDEGLFGASYTNLSLRYALGLGIAADIDEAIKLEILSQKTDHPDFDGISLELIDIYEQISGRMNDLVYKNRYSSLVKQANQATNNPWTIFNQTTEEYEYSANEQQAFIDFLLLNNLLSKREGWKNKKYWNAVYRQALVNFRSLDDIDTILEQDSDPFIFATFDKAMRKGEKSKFELSADDQKKFKAQIRFYKRLNKYFQEHGLGKPPLSSSDRFRKSHEFTEMIPPQYNHAYALFDEEVDGEDASWLAKAAFILDMHLDNDGLFNPTEAERLNIKAVGLGNSYAAIYLGSKYHYGNEIEIDLEKALYWYKRANELSNRFAKKRIADVFKFQNELNNPDIQNPYTDEIIELYRQGYDEGDLIAGYNYACLFINGYNRKPINVDFGLQVYDYLLGKDPNYAEETTQKKIALIMAMRSFLGIDVEKNNQKALDYLEMIPDPDQTNHGYIKHSLNEWKKLLEKYIRQESQANNNDLILIQQLCSGSRDIQKTIQKMDAGSIKISDQLVNYVVCAEWLANNEEWKSRYDWNDLAEATQAHQLGHSFAKAVQSTRDSGPRYTPLDDRGMPILGVLMQPSQNDADEQEQRLTTGSYVPQPGLIKITGIIADEEGFRYKGLYSEDLPSMISLEDQQIAEILIFGDPKKHPLNNFPVLSLETENNDEYGKGAEGSGYDKSLLYKIYTPQWLAYTDFGRTFWVTDKLIGDWCWNPERFKIGAPEDCVSPDLHFMAKNFVKDLRLTGGRGANGASSRVMIQPLNHYILPDAPEKPTRKSSASVDIKDMTMQVYGSYILKDNRKLFEKDPNFAQGRTVQKLTGRYNDIMKLDPRFERAQQLMALLYGHLRLWELGYRPSEEVQNDLITKRKALESLGRDKDERLMVRRGFALRPY